MHEHSHPTSMRVARQSSAEVCVGRGTQDTRVLRPLLVIVAAITLFVGVGASRPHEAEAQSGSPIVDTALKYLDTHGGQCWTFMRNVVAEATGRQVGFDYRQGFFEAGAVEVSAEEALAGDIIQIASDANTAPWASYPGLHTAIIMENLGGGVFNAIDSNQNWDEWVRLRPNYNPYAAAARYGLQVHIYRIPGGSASDAAIPASVATDSGEWAAGDTAVVATGSDCLNLRSGASLSATRVTCLPSGTSLTAAGGTVAADGFVWLEVNAAEHYGWVAAMYVNRTGAAPPAAEPVAEPVVDAAPAESAAVTLSTAYVDDSPGCLRFRDLPSVSGAIRDCFDAGTPLTVLNESTVAADGYAWINIRTAAGYEGWVASEYLIR